MDTQLRQGLPLRLADVKYGHRLKRHLGHFHLFCNKLLGLGIQYVLFYRNLVRAGSQNLDATLPPPHLPFETFLPRLVARHIGSVRALHTDQDGVVDAVFMKLGHGF